MPNFDSKFFRKMLRFFCIICVFLVFNCQSKFLDNNSSKPKIIVGVVVDQMRYDYLTRLENKFTEYGFNRLINDGFNCTNNHYNFVPTVTGPGHSSIATGSTPSVHGIVGNEWYVRNLQKNIYCATDLNYENIGGNAYYGKKSPNNLLVTTFADQNRIQNKMRSKTISVSIKDRGAIFMGGKNANAAYWFYGKNKGEWITSSFYMNELPSWVKKFNEPENISRFLNEWELLYDLKSYDLKREDNNDFEIFFKGKNDSSFPYLTKNLMEKNDGFDMISETPFGNSMTTDFAIAAIEGEKLGDDEYTDVLTISYSSTDYIGHNFGVFSLETEDAYLRLDLEIKRLLDYLDNKMGKNNYSLFLTADHGEMGGAHGLRHKGPFMYRENLNIPLVIRDPDGEKGIKSNALMSAIDFGPTLIGLIGEDYKSVEARLKGYDYSNIVKGVSAKDQRDEILVCFSNTTQGNSRLEKIRMVQKEAEKNGAPAVQFSYPDDFIQFDKRTLGRGIITSKYKYSRWFTPGDHHLPKTWETLVGRNDLELYDLDADPLEMTNLAENPESQRELILDLNNRLNRLINKEVGEDLGAHMPGEHSTWTSKIE